MPDVSLPPGPRSALPQLLHLKDPFPLMDQLQAAYSDPMTCPLLGQKPMVLTWSPEGIQAVFSAPPDTFEPGAAEALAAIVGRGSIFLQSGEAHRRSRKLLMPPFQGERMRAYADVIAGATGRWLERQPIGFSHPVLPMAQGITLDVIVEAVFGERDPARTAALHDQILAIVAAFNPLVATFRFLQKDFGGMGPWARLQRAATALRSSVSELADKKRALPGEDVLSLLLAARDEGGQGIDEQSLYEQLLTFVIAGHETTATSLAWALYEVHRHPEVHQKLISELKTLETENPKQLADAPYLNAVIAETLRRHPPLPIVPRRLTRPFQLQGFELPAGQTIGVAMYMAHHDPATYPDPHVFRPERFLDARPSPFLYLPFGGGARRCIGAAFASYELKLALGTLLQKSAFRLNEPNLVRSVFRVGTYGPETGIRMTRLS
jgi:cytochrome P450 family 110